MRNYFVMPVTGILLLLALSPWLIQACAPRPMLPIELRQHRIEYEQKVAAVQTATMVAQRSAPSEVTVITSTSESNADVIVEPSSTVDAMSLSLPSSATPIEESKPITETPVPSDENTITQNPIKIIAESSFNTTPTSTPMATTSNVILDDLAISAPASTQFNAIQDTITDEMLTQQVRQDIASDAISDLFVAFTPDGIQATGVVSWLVFKQPIEAIGTLAVADENLVVKVTSIKLNGNDVTEQYRSQVEDGIKSSFYRLLPERHVQSFQLLDGQVIVNSQMRAQ